MSSVMFQKMMENLADALNSVLGRSQEEDELFETTMMYADEAGDYSIMYGG
jgi:hypothetical protein